jgi:ribosomal 50S subunit-recycling heat shock protein
VRLDKFLQLSRLVKRRTVAHALCARGRVRLNGLDAKPASAVAAGDVITVTYGDRRVVAKVLAVPARKAAGGELVDILGRVRLPDLAIEPRTADGRGRRDDRH